MDLKSTMNQFKIIMIYTTFTQLLLLLLGHFSCVRLCVTPSLRFSRLEHWSGLPFPSPMHKSESEVAQSCLTLRNPMDCSLPGSSIHGIFQARVLEWGAIAFTQQQDTNSIQVPIDHKLGDTGTYPGTDLHGLKVLKSYRVCFLITLQLY